jgi:hypothetical protein
MKNIKDLKVAIVYDNRHGRNDGPPRYYLNALGKMGVKVDHLILGEPGVEKNGPYDLWIWVDWGEDAVIGREQALKLTIPDDGGKKVYIVSDAHLDDGYRFEKAKQFDYVFFNQKHYIEENKTYLLRPGNMDKSRLKGYDLGEYLPHAAEPDVFYNFNKGDMAITKKYDLCFIGHMQEYERGNGLGLSRIDVLDHMFKAIPNFYFGSRNPGYPDKNMFRDAAKKFCESKIVFNVSIGNDVNMRLWETLSTGSFLLTNDIPELKNIEDYGLKAGIHYVAYNSLEDAVKKAKYYIEHDEEREKIAEAGYNQFLKTGTYETRVKEIFDKIGVKSVRL